MKVKDITTCLEQWAPLSLQESYDNCGLIIGDSKANVQNVLITLDVTEAVVDEAIKTNCQLIVAHHPLIFDGLKRIGTSHWVEKTVRKAIKNDLNIYALHTNLDNINTGVNTKIAEMLQLKNCQILRPKETLNKLVTFVPNTSIEIVLNALFMAGAGNIGEYAECSFQTAGIGTFLPSENANPTIGTKGELKKVGETRIEVLVPSYSVSNVLAALKENHPYEEVAYYLTSLQNKNQETGSGMIGTIEAMGIEDFIGHMKRCMNLSVIKQTINLGVEINRIAVCGGSGRFLLEDAIRQGAQVFISSDFKYHDYFEANGDITILDIGHYESEVFTKELVFDFLKQKFANIAFRLSGVNTNPIIYS